MWRTLVHWCNAQGNSLNLEGINQRVCGSLHFFMRRHNQVEAAGHHIQLWVDSRRFFENLLNSRV